ncbi:MAG: NADH-quinone oxidoreductase subunit K [Planctomycetota bacterium]
MTVWIDSILAVLVLTSLMLLGSSRLTACIRFAAIQGIVLGFLPFFAHDHFTWRTFVLAGAGIGLRGVAFPALLNRALRDAEVRREMEPFIGYTLSLLLAVLLLGASLWIGRRLPIPGGVASDLLVPVAFHTILVGLLLIISRRKALTQVLGYLVIENGIFAFGVSLAQEAPLIVELGVLLDVFVAVFVMGIIIFHINREFDHIDVDRLSALKDWHE